jgi:hypothetical protein
MKKMLNIFICSSREKVMTVPRKKAKHDPRIRDKAESAAQIDKVLFFFFVIV